MHKNNLIMNIQYYKTKTTKGKTNVAAFYHHNLKTKVIVPTFIYNYLLEKIETKPPFKEFDLSIALYYLSLIMSIPASHKDKIYLWGYVPLDSKILKKNNYLYYKYFEYFINIQILEYRNQSTTSHRCKSYRYNFSVIKSEGTECIDFTSFEIENEKFNKKIKAENLCNDSFTSCPHLCKWFNNQLNIDFEALTHNLQSEFCYNKYKFIYNKLNPNITKAYNYWYSALDLKYYNFRTSRNPEADNRLHTNLTNMPSKFRPYITYKEENIISLDIKNSQPYFMVLLLERYNGKRIKRIIKNIYGNIGIILPILSKKTNNQAFRDEFLPIKEAILSGNFYEFLENYFPDIKADKDGLFKKYFYNSDTKKSEIIEFESKRDLMKKLTLQILYTPLSKPSNEYKIFKQHFPILCKCLEIFKSQSTKKDAYKQFPKLLQQIEADCVLDFVSNNLAQKYPEMPLWTIHDSFCTTQDWIYVMQETVNDMLLSYSGGLSPKLKTECWCAEKDCLNVA